MFTNLKHWKTSLHSLDLSSPSNGTVKDIVWSPDSQYFALISFPPLSNAAEGIQATGHVYLMTPGTWQVNKELGVSPTVSTACVTWSPNGSQIATVEPDAVTIWETETGSLIQRLTKPDAKISIAAWSPKGNQLAVGMLSSNGIYLALWDAVTGSREGIQLRLPEKTSGIAWVAWSPDASKLAALVTFKMPSFQQCYRLVIWESQGEGEPLICNLPPGIVEKQGLSHGWSPDSNQIAVAVGFLQNPKQFEMQSAITIWNATTGQMQKQILYKTTSLLGAAWSPDGSILATSTSKELLLFDPSTAILKARLNSFFQNKTHQITSDRKRGSVYLTTQGFTCSHAWSPDGRWLVAANVGGLRVWKCSS